MRSLRRPVERTIGIAWGAMLTLEPARWDSSKDLLSRAQRRPGSADSTPATTCRLICCSTAGRSFGPSGSERTAISVNIEHDRGPFNGRAEIVGTVIDPSGAVVAGAHIEVRGLSTAKTRNATSNAAGQFSLSGLPAGEYVVQVSIPGFKIASQGLTLHARDRAVLSATLSVGQSSEVVEVTGASPVFVETESAMVGIPGGAAGGVIGGIAAPRAQAALPLNNRNVTDMAVLEKKTEVINGQVAKDGSASPAAHVRSYFPEALYINPEIITDKDGRASIAIPMADSITTWRMAMMASTQHGALGSATSSLKVFQDFFVDLDLPVTLTQGDRVSIPVAVYNYSGARGDVSLQLQAGRLVLSGRRRGRQDRSRWIPAAWAARSSRSRPSASGNSS